MRKIAFYSYKGGTGRTLLVANAASFLAMQGCTVVLVDLDLEAPGLLKKFGKSANKGFIDYLDAFLKKTKNLDLKDYVESINDNIHILSAGNPNHSSYPEKLARINWHYLLQKKIIFSNKTIADSFFNKLEKSIKKLFPKTDYILFDCRTGITNISDIVLNDLSDEIVCLFLNNEENFDGISRIIKSSIKKNKNIYPVVSRFPKTLVSTDETKKKDDIINELKKRIGDNKKIPELNVFHSDVSIEFLEQIKYAEDKVLKHSVLLQDYLLFFQKIFNNEVESSQYRDYIKLVNKRSKYKSLNNNVSQKPYDFIENDKKRQNKFKKIDNFKFQIVGPKYFKNSIISEFTSSIIDNMKSQDQIGIQPKMLDKNINWNLLGFQFNEGAVDFCADLYYLNETRKNLVDILQIGFLNSFVIVIPKKSMELKETYDSFNENYLDIFFDQLPNKQQYSFSVMGDQTAASECYRYFSKIDVDNTTLYEFVNSEKDEKDIAKKLEQNYPNQLAIVDHVTANMIIQHLENKKDFMQLKFLFRKKIPVGFLYKKDCPNIRYEINKAMYKYISKGNIKDNWEKISNELKDTYSINAFEWDILEANLIWDLKLSDALELYNKLNSKNENS